MNRRFFFRMLAGLPFVGAWFRVGGPTLNAPDMEEIVRIINPYGNGLPIWAVKNGVSLEWDNPCADKPWVDPNTPVFQIGDGKKEILRLTAGRELILWDGIEPEDAARRFAEALKRELFVADATMEDYSTHLSPDCIPVGALQNMDP